MEINLEMENIPSGYSVCFNGNCGLRDRCLRHQVYLLTSVGRQVGSAVYPSAWASGECQQFCEASPVQMAWGFGQIYKNVPRYQQAEARRQVKAYFSSGNGPYYRYHHGENKLSPSQQADILKILARFGPTEGLAFDHYETAFDFA